LHKWLLSVSFQVGKPFHSRPLRVKLPLVARGVNTISLSEIFLDQHSNHVYIAPVVWSILDWK
ncbi:MAG: hypothetical protein OXF58_08150, partial [Gammaproteobacteria bacterium]|nr:hypothetical protein [Gammaproteobacteria bacterium]